jgi:uncharacterized protein YjbJ (UPF0337 family)
MNEDRIEGTARSFGGKAQEAAGRMTGDAQTRAEGALNQAAGRAQQLYGEATETASDAIDALEERAEQSIDLVREFIETRPYTSALIALGIGWLIGKVGRSGA